MSDDPISERDSEFDLTPFDGSSPLFDAVSQYGGGVAPDSLFDDGSVMTGTSTLIFGTGGETTDGDLMRDDEQSNNHPPSATTFVGTPLCDDYPIDVSGTACIHRTASNEFKETHSESGMTDCAGGMNTTPPVLYGGTMPAVPTSMAQQQRIISTLTESGEMDGAPAQPEVPFTMPTKVEKDDDIEFVARRKPKISRSAGVFETITPGQVFLRYMEDRAHSTPNLLPTGEFQRSASAPVVWERLKDMDRLIYMEQVIRGFRAACDCFNKAQDATKKSKDASSIRADQGLRCPSYKEVYCMNDGSVCLRPEDLVKPSPDGNPLSIWDIMIHAFGRKLVTVDNLLSVRREQHSKDYETALFSIAGMTLRVARPARDTWMFQNRMSVPYSEFACAFSDKFKKFGTGLETIKAVVSLMNSVEKGEAKVPNDVTYKMFADTYQVFGLWWMPPMSCALKKLCESPARDGISFLTATSSVAETFLKNNAETAKCVVRPRSKRDEETPNEHFWPFAITLKDEHSDHITHFVIEYDPKRSRFFVPMKNGGEYASLNDGETTPDLFSLCDSLLRSLPDKPK